MKIRISSLALLIVFTSSCDPSLSLPWLSGIAAYFIEHFTTDLRVNAPPAFSKKTLFP